MVDASDKPLRSMHATRCLRSARAMFAGRQAIGTGYPQVSHKQGVWHTIAGEEDKGAVLACGLACSEIFSGPQLANVLRASHEMEARAIEAMGNSESYPALALHTSAGIIPALPKFIDALCHHLPASWSSVGERDIGDCIVSLQMTGADAIWAAVDLLLQLQQIRGNKKRKRVAVADWSYHGPGTSAFGRAAPLGDSFKSPLQVRYPCPSIFARRSDELDVSMFHARVLNEFEVFLHSEEGRSVGVMLIEPQWGSSNLAQTWDPKLLSKFVALAQDQDILVCSDEIMCGLGRHGQGTTFLADAWDIPVDAITFGKSVAAGIEPLSGVAIRNGAHELGHAGKSVLQSHTYSGASARALTTGIEVLSSLLPEDHAHFAGGGWVQRVSSLGENVVRSMFEQLQVASDGMLGVQGQGFMWGAAFLHEDETERTAAVNLMRKHCEDQRVMPYFVPHSGGFMFTPLYDISEADLEEAGNRLCRAVEMTTKELRVDRYWDTGLAFADAKSTPENIMLPLAQKADYENVYTSLPIFEKSVQVEKYSDEEVLSYGSMR